jgi:NAD(P)-dependent dehydrogenase (short-subunit alcohol dehydrogenase family)
MAAVVTGAGSGLGRSMALALAEAGANVALAGRRRDRLDSVAAEIRQAGGEPLVAPTDVTRPDQLDALAELAAERFGGIDVLVNDAGTTFRAPSETFPAEEWDRLLTDLETTSQKQGAILGLTEARDRLYQFLKQLLGSQLSPLLLMIMGIM